MPSMRAASPSASPRSIEDGNAAVAPSPRAASPLVVPLNGSDAAPRQGVRDGGGGGGGGGVEETASEYSWDDDGTIKLGLGDFVFYSILAGKSALVSFTTFIVVFLCIQVGLALTMLLLALYKQALPALPLSIFLGLFFFLVTDVVVVPWVSFNAAAMQVV